MDTDRIKAVEPDVTSKEQKPQVKQIANTEKKIKGLSKQFPETAQKSRRRYQD